MVPRPQNLLDYADPKTVSPSVRQAPLDRPRWFTITAQTIALVLIAAPIGAITIPLLNHSYGLVGAAVFVGGAVGLVQLCPSEWARWRLLLAAAAAAIMVTAALHFASINTFVIENASAQSIRHISFHPISGGYSLELQDVPQATILRLQVHDLFYDGRGNVGGGELADGTPLDSSLWEIKGSRYQRITKIRVEPSGRVEVAWP